MTVAIYLDMDEVLVDFADEARRIFPQFDQMQDWFYKGHGSKTDYKILSHLLTKKIAQIPDFWVNLGWFRGGPLLWRYISGNFPTNNIAIATAPMKTPFCCEQKWQWCERNLITINPQNFFCLEEKAKVINKIPADKQILIDDRPLNIENWEKAGGIGIVHTHPDLTIARLKEICK